MVKSWKILGTKRNFIDALRRWGRAVFKVVMITLLSFPSIRTVYGQQGLVIAATVNDEMISILDVETRVVLSIHLAELPNTKETRRRLADRTLRALIDNKLKLQEAQKFRINVTRGEVSKAQTLFERQAGIEKGGLRKLHKRLGLDLSSFQERLQSQVAWSKLVTRRYLSTINIGEKEIDYFIASLERSKGKPEYLVSEIFLPVGRDQSISQTQGLAERLVQKISSGSSFGAIARNFSQSATAAVNGSLGWHGKGQLPAKIDAAIRRLEPGQISRPIQTLEGFYILRLDQKRTIDPFRDRTPGPSTVTLSQAHFPLPKDAADSLVTATMENARQLSAATTSCPQLDELSKQTKSPLSGQLGTFKINQLSAQLQGLVTTLPTNQASAPVKSGDGIIVVMVCNRKTPRLKTTTPAERRERVKNQLVNERLNLAGEQYIRSLRRTAIVDVRL